jgi:crotonobetainyl-CoA:carnitine CoA-transferase CaiB-like acyl-CoA transferase
MSAIYAFGAIQTALLHRERFGGGQHIDVNLVGSVLNMLVYECQAAQFQSDHRRPLYQPLKAADGFVMAAPVNQKNFESLAEAIGRPDLKDDVRFSTIQAREQNWAALMTEIEAWTSHRSALSCEEILMRAGVPCSRYASVAELLQDRDLKAQGTFVEVEDGSGSFVVPRQPFRLSNSSVAVGGRVSDLGADSDAILGEMLGLSKQAITELKSAGIVA